MIDKLSLTGQRESQDVSNTSYSLHNKRIILGITGGIAAYKSAELCRMLIKAGADVRVVMTRGAMEFIAPLTMQALSGHRVHTELLDEESELGMSHIELARWADLVLVAPASADFLARLTQGRADDLLTTVCIATRAPLTVAPAMNQAMWLNSHTTANIDSLAQHGVHVMGPAEGEQACGEVGPGRMLEPEELLAQAAALFETGALAGLHVLITAGPTVEPIDPVRFISNRSSGKMGYALAEAAVEAGAKVTLVSGPVTLPTPDRVELVSVQTAEEMLQACLHHKADIFISVAAVADYRPVEAERHKIKKTDDTLTITLVRNPDILATISKQAERPFCVGFAAETENLEDNARAKLEAKQLDLILANHATDTFGQDMAALTAYWPGGSNSLGSASKTQHARAIIDLIARRRTPTHG